MGVIRILNEHGDETLEWDPADDSAVKEAHKKFKALKKDGYEFYEVKHAKGKRIDKFNKKLGKVIAAPGARSTADKATGARPRASSGGPNSSVERAA